MNYKKIYDSLVTSCKSRGLDRKSVDYYTELHHIVPRSMGGSDDSTNLVMLSAREHYVAHILLWKIYPNEVAISRAAFLMGSRSLSFRNSHTYEKVKEDLSAKLSIEMTGENNPFFGRKHTDETKEKFKSRVYLKGEDSPHYGRKASAETREKMRQAVLGREWTENQRQIMSQITGEKHHFFGKNHSEITKQKISQAHKDRDQRPWENLSTQTDESMMKWAMCDHYYDLWVEFEKPGLKKFTKIYNEIYCDNVSLSFFTNPRLNFLQGWNPHEDAKWHKYREEFLGTAYE